ncbi:class I SAM-dependent methyltransferase [Ornithinibacillus salinisoli]|uniref:Class I SAM-dependent methyltransferase n=1 Tax=Ornithinibacillus salinisoli TaxID=1848459 RepID=A0ABW4W2X7_9BACI
MGLINPSTLSGWLRPHSIEWYEQLSKLQGKYAYTWNTSYVDPNGESIFDKEVARMIVNKKVLDVGCGHGEYTIQCSLLAEEIVGFDVTDDFIIMAEKNNQPNVTFVKGSTKYGFPFEKDEFDCAYIRKGPTSSYPLLEQVVKKGGNILGLHPGDDLGKELPILFPNLFEDSNGSPILDAVRRKLDLSRFKSIDIESVNSTEYLQSPLDVLKLRCFGQPPQIYDFLKEQNLVDISRIFERNATKQGLPLTFLHYLVRVTV